jgi:sugar lactone lactonase YvrE
VTTLWQLIAQYDGWPNGMAMHRDGSLWITDYRQGLLKLSGEQLKRHVMGTDPSLKVADPSFKGADPIAHWGRSIACEA